MAPERRDYVSSLIEEVQSNDDRELLAQPDMIVCVPAAAHNESQATLAKMFDSVATQQGADQFEVLLFGNYPDTIDDKAAIGAHKNISLAVQRARERHPDLYIRHATISYEEATMGISKVRKDMMDIVAADAVTRGLPYDQPIMWVDADTTNLSKDALETAADAIRGTEAFFYHLNPRQTIEGLGAAVLSQATAAQQISAHYELGRRRVTRKKLQRDPSLRDQYVEEPGLGFSLGNYILVGGVNQGDAANESRWLLGGFEQQYQKAISIDLAAKGKEITPKNTERVLLKYLPTARIYTSGRRLVANAQEVVDIQKAGQLPPFNANIADEYTDFSHTENLRDNSSPDEDEFSDDDKEKYFLAMTTRTTRVLSLGSYDQSLRQKINNKARPTRTR
jgi:hypothetical protein